MDINLFYNILKEIKALKAVAEPAITNVPTLG